MLRPWRITSVGIIEQEQGKQKSTTQRRVPSLATKGLLLGGWFRK